MFSDCKIQIKISYFDTQIAGTWSIEFRTHSNRQFDRCNFIARPSGYAHAKSLERQMWKNLFSTRCLHYHVHLAL